MASTTTPRSKPPTSLPRARHVNDRIVRPIGDAAASAPSRRKPRRPRMRDAPDPQLFLLGVSAYQRCLEGGRRSEPAELVGGQGTTAIEAEAEDALVGCAAVGKLVGGRQQQPEARRPGFLRSEGRLKCDGERFGEQLCRHLQRRVGRPMILDVPGKVGWVSGHSEPVSHRRRSGSRRRAPCE
jgi:hypothetical protein